MCFSSKAVQIISFVVGFFICTRSFLFFFVEKKDLCCSISLLGGSFFPTMNDLPTFCLALIKFRADEMYDLIPFKVSVS